MRTDPAPQPGRLTLLAEGCTGMPRISGNGRVVVWAQEQPDGRGAIMRYEDGVTTRVSEDGYDCGNPCVSDDGRVLAYSRYTPSTGTAPAGFDIFQSRIDEHGGVTTSVVAAGPGNELSVSISGDGSVIAFDDDMDGTFRHWRVGKWQDGQVRYLTNGQPDASFPVVASGTGQVFFREIQAGHSRTWGEGPDGEVRIAIDTPGDTIRPDVSADAQAFTWTDRSLASTRVFVLRDGQMAVAAAEPGLNFARSRLSGDGRWLVYSATDHRDADPEHPAVRLLCSDGQQVGVVAASDGQGDPVAPDVSNDGQRMAWAWVDHQDAEHTRIYLWERAAPVVDQAAPAARQDQQGC